VVLGFLWDWAGRFGTRGWGRGARINWGFFFRSSRDLEAASKGGEGRRDSRKTGTLLKEEGSLDYGHAGSLQKWDRSGLCDCCVRVVQKEAEGGHIFITCSRK